MITVNENIQNYRMDICNSCEFLENFKRCAKCGCIMPLKTKLANSKCPIDKWDKVSEEKL